MTATEVYKVRIGDRYEASEELGTFVIQSFITPANGTESWQARVLFDNPATESIIPVKDIAMMEKVTT